PPRSPPSPYTTLFRSGRDFDVYTTNNIEATQVLLEACVKFTLDRIVYASSSSVYGDDVPMPMREDALPKPVSPYGVTKLAAGHLDRKSTRLNSSHLAI